MSETGLTAPLFLRGMYSYTENYIDHVGMERACERGYRVWKTAAWLSSVPLDKLTCYEVLVSHVTKNSASYVVNAGEAVILATKSGLNRKFKIYAADQAALDKTLEDLEGIFAKEAIQDNKLALNIWSAESPDPFTRKITTPGWKDIQGNYPAGPRDQLGRLMTLDPKEAAGRLVLFVGEPGTGKSFALRALAEEWKAWCRLEYVVDPEKFFGSADYMLRVVLGDDDDEYFDEDDESIAELLGHRPAEGSMPEKDKWRLVVLEDTGEFLTKDAKDRTGQGLSRLLNLSDGLLGQGLKVMVLITTNEHLGALHAAASRPGRCHAVVNFEKFDVASAVEWLKGRSPEEADTPTPRMHSTLAELYALLAGEVIPEGKAEPGFIRRR